MFDWMLDKVARERHDITRTTDASPYLVRWVLYGSRDNSPTAVYVHKFIRSDEDEMHDHPWPFTSVILFNGYYEETPALGWKNGDGPTKLTWYGPGRVLHRPANWIHGVRLHDFRPTYTIVFRGIKERSWGILVSEVWIPSLASTLRNCKEGGTWMQLAGLEALYVRDLTLLLALTDRNLLATVACGSLLQLTVALFGTC